MLGNTALESDKVPGLQIEMDFRWPFGQLHASCKWLRSNSHVQRCVPSYPVAQAGRKTQKTTCLTHAAKDNLDKV